MTLSRLKLLMIVFAYVVIFSLPLQYFNAGKIFQIDVLFFGLHHYSHIAGAGVDFFSC
jgi:hypothetical protein